jgi:hypothetical protein
MSDRPKATVTAADSAPTPAEKAVDKPLPIDDTPPHDERTTTAMPDAPLAMVRLTLPTKEGAKPFSGELKIGNSRYQVSDGVVVVPPWHADDARAAGYQG